MSSRRRVITSQPATSQPATSKTCNHLVAPRQGLAAFPCCAIRRCALRLVPLRRCPLHVLSWYRRRFRSGFGCLPAGVFSIGVRLRAPSSMPAPRPIMARPCWSFVSKSASQCPSADTPAEPGRNASRFFRVDKACPGAPWAGFTSKSHDPWPRRAGPKPGAMQQPTRTARGLPWGQPEPGDAGRCTREW